MGQRKQAAQKKISFSFIFSIGLYLIENVINHTIFRRKSFLCYLFLWDEQPSDRSVSSRALRCYTEIIWFLPSWDQLSKKSNVCLWFIKGVQVTEKIQSQPTALERLPSNWLGSGSDPKTVGLKKKKRREEFEYSLSVTDISKAARNGNTERLTDRDSAAVSLQAFLCSYDLGQANFWQISQGPIFLSGEAVVSISKGWIYHSAEQLCCLR